MNSIELTAEYLFAGDVSELKNNFDEIIKSHPGKYKFVNTEAALLGIVRGGLDYFDKLDSSFLGKENDSSIPSMEADYFANNFYRLSNTLDYLAKLWIVPIADSKEWNLLKDIRTLIVHSGGQLTNIESLELENYKDAQLGRIIRSRENRIFRAFNKSNFDYCIQVWTDKHDTSKRPENEVDYDNRKQNFRDIDILLNAADVRNIVLSRIELFISEVKGKSPDVKKIPKLPEAVKDQIVVDGDFDKLEALIRNKHRGDYIIENEKAIWFGFGLQRLWRYVSYRFGIQKNIQEVIKNLISSRLSEFWFAYNDETISDYELPSLDIRDVFKEYTPEYDKKHYLEGEKLFIHIAPMFNRKDSLDSTDVDYLLRFIYSAQEALGTHLNLENDVNGVICDYFVKSVEMKLREEAEINGR